MGIEALVRGVSHTSAQAALFNQALAGQLGVGATDLECLALLQELETASAGQLAELLSLTTGAITGVVDRLEAAGFVARESDPADRRRVIVRLAPARLPDLERAYEPLLQATAGLLAERGDHELGLLLDFQRGMSDVLRQETERLKAEARPSAGPPLSAPLGDLEAACLEFATGAAGLTVRAGDQPGELYRATFEGVHPAVRVQGGSVIFRYRRMSPFDWGKHAGTVLLNASIPWTLAIQGGASDVEVDAAELDLRGFTVGGGASKLRLVLPGPRGVVPVRIGGGVSRVEIRRPPGVGARLQLHGGASRLEFDGQRFGAVGGEVRLVSPEWAEEAAGYDIEVRGGASRLQVEIEGGDS